MKNKIDFEKAKAEMKRIDIVEYIKSKGYKVIKKGRNYGIDGYSSMVISTKNNEFYYNATGGAVRGDCANFEMWAENVDFTTALKNVLENAGNNLFRFEISEFLHINEIKEFILPVKASTNKNVFAYLNKTRGISCGIIEMMINDNRLYQDKNNNCVFVSYDETGKANFATRRGTLSNIKFHGDIANSDYAYGMQIPPKDKKQNSTLIIAEAMIDILSIIDMVKSYKMLKKDVGQLSFLSLSGSAKYSISVEKYLELYPKINKVIIMTDKDHAGFLSAKAIDDIVNNFKNRPKTIMLFPQHSDDWNAEHILLQKTDDMKLKNDAKDYFTEAFNIKSNYK